MPSQGIQNQNLFPFLAFLDKYLFFWTQKPPTVVFISIYSGWKYTFFPRFHFWYLKGNFKIWCWYMQTYMCFTTHTIHNIFIFTFLKTLYGIIGIFMISNVNLWHLRFHWLYDFMYLLVEFFWCFIDLCVLERNTFNSIHQSSQSGLKFNPTPDQTGRNQPETRPNWPDPTRHPTEPKPNQTERPDPKWKFSRIPKCLDRVG